MGDLPKLAWSRDVTGKVDNIHSNLTHFLSVPKGGIVSKFDCIGFVIYEKDETPAVLLSFIG